MRAVLLPLVTAAAALTVPAVAAERTVTNDGDTWTPAALSITAGDTVTWSASSGFHDLAFSDGAPGRADPGSGWTATRRFDAVGTVRFRCTVHSTSFTDGMTGTVSVAAAPVATSSPSAYVSPAWATAPVATRAPSTIESVRIRVRRRVATATVRVTHATRLTGTLARRPLRGARRYRSVGAMRAAELRAGRNVFVVRRRTGAQRLARGRYRLWLDTGSDRRTTTFRVP